MKRLKLVEMVLISVSLLMSDLKGFVKFIEQVVKLKTKPAIVTK